jgi:hypothetical protein
MSLGIYLAGFLIVIGGLIYGAVILHVAAHWIAVGGARGTAKRQWGLFPERTPLPANPAE